MPQRGTASATAATFAPNRPRSAAPLPHAQPAAWPLSCIEPRLRRAHRGERRRAVLLRRGFGAARTWEGAGARSDAAVVGAGGWPDREAVRWRQGRSWRRYCLSHAFYLPPVRASRSRCWVRCSSSGAAPRPRAWPRTSAGATRWTGWRRAGAGAAWEPSGVANRSFGRADRRRGDAVVRGPPGGCGHLP